MVILGDRRITHDFHKISGNRGQSTTAWRGRISNPNRGFEFPIFAIVLSLVALTCFAPTFGIFLFAISYREWPFSATDKLPAIFIKFRKIADNLPLFGETLY